MRCNISHHGNGQRSSLPAQLRAHADMLDLTMRPLLQIAREITPVRAAKTLFMPIVMVIGVPAAVLSLLYLLIGVDPRPDVGVFLGDAFGSSLPIIGYCLLIWLAHVVVYTFLVRSRPTQYVAALRDHPIPEPRVRWCPPVDRWRILSWVGLRLHRQLTFLRGLTRGMYAVWRAGTHPQLE